MRNQRRNGRFISPAIPPSRLGKSSYEIRATSPVKFVSTAASTSEDKVSPLTPRQLLEKRYAKLCEMRDCGTITESQVEEFHFLKKKLAKRVNDGELGVG